MKAMSCKQLGGACNEVFTAQTFEEIAALSKKHGQEMYKKGDVAHLEAMKKMQQVMKSPEAMQSWFANRREAFNALPEL